MTKKRYLNIKEVAAYTSISVKTLYKWSSEGIVPSIKIGGKRLFDLRDIDRTMESFKSSTL